MVFSEEGDVIGSKACHEVRPVHSEGQGPTMRQGLQIQETIKGVWFFGVGGGGWMKPQVSSLLPLKQQA